MAIWKYTIRVNLISVLLQRLSEDRGEGGVTQGLGPPTAVLIQVRPTQMPLARRIAIAALPYVETITEAQIP